MPEKICLGQQGKCNLEMLPIKKSIDKLSISVSLFVLTTWQVCPFFDKAQHKYSFNLFSLYIQKTNTKINDKNNKIPFRSNHLAREISYFYSTAKVFDNILL